MNQSDLSKFAQYVAIVPAAGFGQRFSTDKPKQYCKIGEEYILDLTLSRLIDSEKIGMIVLVVSADDEQFIHLKHIKNSKIITVEGGKERINSVANALNYLSDKKLHPDCGVLVHDAARPVLSSEDLLRLFEAFEVNREACLLVAEIVDTLQQLTSDNKIEQSADRKKIVRALTPQMASFNQLQKAIDRSLAENKLVTDEVTALRNAGYSVCAVYGNSRNIKITYPDDLLLAEFYLENDLYK
ncbi:MAG: 2-C-methyl-D-erythritol 4-phosphate cytidylyltransferase [Gammaproteobacteria bacterium]|nr:2-C-methyl-D-erythritol 4-phosphate cytidylyltransferase [Gammaproteobacteria bacterium]